MKRTAPTDTHHTHPVPHPAVRTALEKRVGAVVAPCIELPPEIVDHIAFYLCFKYLRTLCYVNTFWRQCAIAHFQGRIEGRLSELEDLVAFLGEVCPKTCSLFEDYKEHQENVEWMRQRGPAPFRLEVPLPYKFIICNKIIQAIDICIDSAYPQNLHREDFIAKSSPKVQSVIQQFFEFGHFEAAPHILHPSGKHAHSEKILAYWMKDLDWDELERGDVGYLWSIARMTKDSTDSFETIAKHVAESDIGIASIHKIVRFLGLMSDRDQDCFLKTLCANWPHKDLPELKQDLFPFLALMKNDNSLILTLSRLLSRYPDLTVETLLALVSTDTHPNVKEIALQEACCMKAKALDFESAFAILPHIDSSDIFQWAGSQILSAATECQDIARVIQAAKLLTPKNRNRDLMLFCRELINDRKLEPIESLLLLIDDPSMVQRVRKWLEEPPVDPDQADPQ